MSLCFIKAVIKQVVTMQEIHYTIYVCIVGIMFFLSESATKSFVQFIWGTLLNRPVSGRSTLYLIMIQFHSE